MMAPKSKTYTVQLTNQKRTGYWFLAFAGLMIVEFGIGFYYNDAFKPLLPFILTTFLVLLFLPMIKKSILSEQKEIEVFDDKMIINDTETTTVIFSEIKSYKIDYFQQVDIKIQLSNKEVQLYANQNYTSLVTLNAFAKDFDMLLKGLIDGGTIQTKRKGSFYQTIWFFLLGVTFPAIVISTEINDRIKPDYLPRQNLFIFATIIVLAAAAFLFAKRKLKDRSSSLNSG